MAEEAPRPSSRDRGERRVVITGLGAVTPLGNDVPSYWEGLVAGRSGIARLASFDPSGVPSQVGGEIKDFDAAQFMDRKDVRRHDKYVHYAWAAAAQALADAGLSNPIVDDADAERAGAIVATGIGGITSLVRDAQAALTEGYDRVGPFSILNMIPDTAAGHVAIAANLRGPNYATVSACASSNHGIGEAAGIIRRGDADVMVAGGSEAAICEMVVAAFCAMRALSTKRNDDPERASRPFDVDRDGFVIADGAGMIVLEDLEHAQARGATIRAEFIGYGASDDASHVTMPAPGGRGAVASMRIALADAGLAPAELDYINAHGTSTPPNDPAETTAIKTVFGEDAYRVPISSTKSMTGHLMGAGGGIEAVACVRALETGTLPPTINHDQADPDCDLDYVPNAARQVPIATAMSNAFGFGGHNATLVFRRWDDA
ncbi:MAG TPA: beta-ketoacyl-ACP synthase II [Candidatus Limnocylindria bacterium]|nr:beta-ketoacyl-ACP synthase II [Candidatus Limnocylindria bacterium]